MASVARWQGLKEQSSGKEGPRAGAVIAVFLGHVVASPIVEK